MDTRNKAFLAKWQRRYVLKDDRMDEQRWHPWNLTWPQVEYHYNQSRGKIQIKPANLLLLTEVKANNRAILRVRNISEADSKGSNIAPDNPSRTTERSQERTHSLQIGLRSNKIQGDASSQALLM